MTQKIFKISFTAIVCTTFGWAVNVSTWTLEDCLVQAKKQSLLLESARADERSTESQLDQAQKSRYPDLSASINQSLFDSPFAEAPQDHYSLSLGLSSSVLLWNAGQMGHNIDQKKYQAQASQAQTAQIQQNLAESVINAYLKYWSLRESQNAAQEALILSKANLEKDSVLFQSGSLVASELAFSEATVAGDSLAVLQSAHAVNQAKTQLRQLLELPLNQSWELAPPDSMDPVEPLDFQTVLKQGMQQAASRQVDSLQVLAAEAAVQKATSSEYPSISLGPAAQTGLRSWQSNAYGSQLKTGYNHRLTLGVNIPIVDWGAAQSNVLQAQIAKEKAQISARNTQKQLENTLEQLIQQTESARLQWQAAQLQFQAQQTALRIVNEKRELGVVDHLAFVQQKNQYQNAQAKLNQAKYSYLLGHALLTLYTEPNP